MNSQASTSPSKIQRIIKLFGFNSLFRGINAVVKRIFDICASLFGLIILSPFFIFIAILIKRDSPGPVFYWGPRMGKKGRIFYMLKFRTMYERPESYKGPRLTANGDPRITPLGAWLRDTKINEFPQLWNVLIGEMSLVGPRPEDPEIAKSWPKDASSKILSIRPGITSPASILYHNEEKMLSNKNAMAEYYASILPDKIRLDQLYVFHHSFFSDLDTIFWTAAVLIPSLARTKIPEGYLFSGPLSRFGTRYFSWFVMDLLESLAAVWTATLIWRTQFPLNWGVGNLIVWGFILAFLFSGLNSIIGLNRIVWAQATAEDAVGLIFSCTCVALSAMGLNFLNGHYHWLSLPELPPTMIVAIGVVAEAFFIVTRYRLRLLSLIADRWLKIRQDNLSIGDRVLVVGDGEAGQIATWLLGRQIFRAAFSIVGIVNNNNPTKHGMRVNGCWMLGSTNDLPKIIERYDIGVILSAGFNMSRKENEYIFDICQTQNIRLIFLNDLMLMVDRQVTQPVGSFEYPVWLDEQLEFKAMHHAITGLPNRYLFQDRLRSSLAYAKRYRTRLAVLLVRIDGVNVINDTIGRKYGDQLMIEIGQRLAKCERESDTLANVGENIFAVILQNIQDEDAANIVAQKIYTSLSNPFKVESHDICLSIEIKVITDTDGYSKLEELYQANIEEFFAIKQKMEVKNWYDILDK